MKRIFAIILSVFLGIAAFGQVSDREFDHKVENRLDDAVRLYTDNKYEDAAKVLKDILSVAPDNDAARFYYGMCCIALRDYDTAEINLERAIELDSNNFWYRYRLATYYSMTGSVPAATTMYEDMLRDFPKRTELYYDLVEIYTKSGEMDKALDVLDKIDEAFGRGSSTAMTRFNILMHLNRQEEAYKGLEEYNKEDSSPEVLAILGDYELYQTDNDSTAVAHYEEALAIAPDYVPARLGLAEAFRMQRRYDEYYPIIRDIISDEALSVEGKCDYLTQVHRQNDPRMVRTGRERLDSLFDILVATHPTDSAALVSTSVYYYQTGRKDLAEKYLKQNVEANPDIPGTVLPLCQFYLNENRYEDLAEFAASSAENLSELTPTLLDVASMAEYQLKNFDKVVELAQKAVAYGLATEDAEYALTSLANLGDAYHAMGDTKSAFKCYKTVLKSRPDYSPVLNNYAYYLSLQHKKLSKAYSMSKKTVEAEPDNPTYLDTFGWILHLQGKDVEAKAIFKHAMMYGGKEDANLLDHYAEVLYALKEYDMAFLYWKKAQEKNGDGEIPDLDERIAKRTSAMTSKK